MDSSWKSLQIRMEAAWNMRTTPKTKRPKTGDIISSAHSLDWNKKKVRQLQQAWNDEVAKLVADRNEAISDVMVDILALIQMDLTPPTIEIVGFLGGAARFIAKPCLKQRVMRFPTIRYGCSAQ